MYLMLFFAAILWPFTIRGQEVWQLDYKKAVEISKEEHKPLVAVFLNPQECPWSQKLEGDLLSSAEFTDALSQEFILLKTQNGPFAKRYHVKEYPIIALFDFQGELFAKVHDLPLPAGDFAAYIKELFFDFQLIKMAIAGHYLKQMPFEQLKTLFQKVDRLENGHFKKEILEEGLKKDRGAFFLTQQYLALIEKEKIKDSKIQKLRKRILERDPKNEHGTHLKIALADFHALAKKVKPHKAIKPLLEYGQKFGKLDQENFWKIEMMLAQFLFSRNLIKEALYHASISHDAAPEVERAELSLAIEYFKKHGK